MKSLWICLAVALLCAGAQAQTRAPYRDPQWAALKSAVVPGWGQWSNGDDNLGVAFFAASSLGLLLGTHTLGVADSERRIETERGFGWALYGVSVLVSTFNAYSRAQEMNRENGFDLGRLELQYESGWNLRLAVVRIPFGGS